MKNYFRNTLVAAAIAIPSLVCLSSCDENDINSALSILNGINGIANSDVSCANAADLLQQSIDAEGQLVDHINTDGDYSMALTLNATSLNKLFRSANEWSYSSVGIGVPTIAVGGCRKTGNLYSYSGDVNNCLSFTIPVSVSGYVDLSATFGIPVSATVKGTEKSSIYVDLSQAQILDLRNGNDHLNSIINQGIELLVKNLLSDYMVKVHMFDIQAWQMGDNQVKMLAGAPKVNEREGTLTFGMYSNLNFAQTGSVDWAYEHSFPSDAELGLHIHPDLIRGLIARMLYEKHIENGVDVGGSSFTVTMADMSKDYDEAYLLSTDKDFYDFLTFGFRFWSTDASSGICGFMDVLAGLNIELDNSKFTIGIGNINAGKSSGGMSLFSGILGAITNTQFFKDVLEYATLTVNFNEITVPDKNASGGMRKAQMGSNTFEFQANGTGISLFLNFLDLENK